MPVFATRQVLHLREFTNLMLTLLSVWAILPCALKNCSLILPCHYAPTTKKGLYHLKFILATDAQTTGRWDVMMFPGAACQQGASGVVGLTRGWIHSLAPWCGQPTPPSKNKLQKVLGPAHPICQTLFSSPQQLEASVNQPEQAGFWLLKGVEAL